MLLTKKQKEKRLGGLKHLTTKYPKARLARLETSTMKIVVEFDNKTEFSFPAFQCQGLSGATPEQLQEIEISPSGLGLHWPQLDADLLIPELMTGLFGSKTWMASIGAKGERPQKNNNQNIPVIILTSKR